MMPMKDIQVTDARQVGIDSLAGINKQIKSLLRSSKDAPARVMSIRCGIIAAYAHEAARIWLRVAEIDNDDYEPFVKQPL